MDVDRYGRMIAIATVGDSVNVNEALLKGGMAWHYKNYDKNPAWAKMESNARNSKLGLWTEPDPIAPWDFRRNERDNR